MTQLLTSSVVQALSFTGASYLFELLEPDKYAAETKRYHDTLIQLQKDKEKFLEKETERREHISKLERELKRARGDIVQTNRALEILSHFRETNREEGPPVLQDYYKPSDEMKEYNIAASVFLAIFLAVGLYFCYKYFF